MPRLAADRTPAYRKHKASGQAVVTLSGVDHYLGPHGTRASNAEYDRPVGGNGWPAAATADLTVVDLVAAFLRHADAYYRRPGGTPTGEATMFRSAVQPLIGLYGRTPVSVPLCPRGQFSSAARLTSWSSRV